MPETETERDLSKYLGKDATTLQARFAAWLQEEVGYNPNNAKNKMEAFTEGVRLATATRMVFQASDYNRNARAEEQTVKPAKVAEPKPAKAAPVKKAARKTAPVAVVAEDATQPEQAAPAAKAAKAPARHAPARRSAQSAQTAEAPF